MTKQAINILCATDKNFLYPTYVFMQSVMDNHPMSTVNFFLAIGEDVSDNDKKLLEAHITKCGHKISFIRQDIVCFDNFILSERFPKAVYFRLMAHKYLPEDIDRILYLDVDIIVDKNIDDLYNMDFEDKYLIAASHNPDPSYYNTLNKHTVNYESAGKGEFFNSGVLLMNLNKFRENITEESYIKAYEICEKENIPIFYDQGLLNFMFFDKTKYVSSMDYNFRYSIPKTYPSRIDPNREYKKSIIHYTGMKQPYKPWDLRFTDEMLEQFSDVPYQDNYFYASKELNDLMEKWWAYASHTPIYDALIEQVEIKIKWFKRNLMDFMIAHNNFVANCSQTTTVKTVTKNKEIPVLPQDFHHRAYKLGCLLCKPYFKLKEFKQKRKSKRKNK